ncbi:DUF2946 family protein [Niveispirillum sp. KHB5.9]|uniref:DUF2946 family protein n=1 Tax=Niveispirillum sp. KHB5.9 TaxID=3400269 RepID=UPI003A83F0CD
MTRAILSNVAGSARCLAPWLLLLALLLRGMIPGGYMPNTDPDNGKGWLVICTGAGSSMIQTGDGDDAPVDTGHQGLCPFMAMTLLGPILLLLALLLPARRDFLVLRPFVEPVRRRLWAGAPLGARAPPMSWAV